MSAVSPAQTQPLPRTASSSLWFQPVAATLLLALTVSSALFWSHYKLLWFDEILVQWTDSVQSARQVADIQLHYPISLDPILFHEIEHAAVKVFGPEAFGLRFPPLVGFLLMQICLCIFVSRIAGKNAGLVALAVPVFTGAFHYSAEARPYALMLGFYTLAMVSWQSAVRPNRKRATALVTLAVAILLSMNIHYYGMLVLIPLFAGEMTRTILNGRVDWPVWATFLVGACGFVTVIPTIPAAHEFLAHLWDREGATFSHVWRTYFMAMPHFAVDHLSPHWMMGVFAVCCAVLFLACLLKTGIWLRRDMLPVTAMVGALMAFPILGFISALLTHALEPRYLIGTTLGIACFVAVSFGQWIPERANAALTAMLALIVILSGIGHGQRDRREGNLKLAGFVVPQATKNILLAHPGERLYTANPNFFSEMTEYSQDPEVRSRLTWVYSEREEIRYAHMDTFSLTALHINHFTSLRTEPFEELAQMPGEHLYLLRPIPDPPPGTMGTDWVTTAAGVRGANMQPLGKLSDGDLLSMSFPSAAK